jgi:hypothetical protein
MSEYFYRVVKLFLRKELINAQPATGLINWNSAKQAKYNKLIEEVVKAGDIKP